MKRVLIVEDNQVLANVYRGMLVMAGFTVVVAADGESGVSAARGTPPDAILLDLMLPKKGGLEVLKEIRADETLSSVPVLVLSNGHTPARMQELADAGATQVLLKASSSPKQVVDAILANVEPR